MIDIKVKIFNIKKKFAEIDKTNKYYYTFSILETIVLVSISIWQFYYMRQLFEIKGSF